MADAGADWPITTKRFAEVIELMRTVGVDLQRYEVKSSKKELTKDIARTVSAFSNGSGGFIICGISEKDGFRPVDGFDAQAIQDSLAHTCVELMTPPVRPDIQALVFEGRPVLIARIPEMRPVDKPCYLRLSDRYKGSYIRTGDGDMRLTPMRSTGSLTSTVSRSTTCRSWRTLSSAISLRSSWAGCLRGSGGSMRETSRSSAIPRRSSSSERFDRTGGGPSARRLPACWRSETIRSSSIRG